MNNNIKRRGGMGTEYYIRAKTDSEQIYQLNWEQIF